MRQTPSNTPRPCSTLKVDVLLPPMTGSFRSVHVKAFLAPSANDTSSSVFPAAMFGWMGTAIAVGSSRQARSILACRGHGFGGYASSCLWSLWAAGRAVAQAREDKWCSALLGPASRFEKLRRSFGQALLWR